VLAELGIPSSAVVPLDSEAWRYLRDIAYISDEMYASLERRRQDKRGWALEALRTHIDRLGAMLESPSEPERVRAMRILDAGYPDHREELLARLAEHGYRVSAKGGE
jgi:hypothetical protein